MGSLRAVIFDVDGTLVDSERHGHRVAFNRAFAEFGLPYEWDEPTYGRLLAVTGGQRRLHAYLAERGVDGPARDDLVPRSTPARPSCSSAWPPPGRSRPAPGRSGSSTSWAAPA